MESGDIRILAVDDEDHALEVVQRYLSRQGYSCVSAPNVNDASVLLKTQEFDLLILDIMMPDKSGIEFLPEIVSQHPDIAVLMMTGVVDTSTAVKAMRDGAYDYVTKPVNLDDLGIRIERALERRSLQIENKEYQQNLEIMVGERTERLEQRMRELRALNKLFQSHLNQVLGTQEAYKRLQSAISSFGASGSQDAYSAVRAATTNFGAQVQTLAGVAMIIESNGSNAFREDHILRT